MSKAILVVKIGGSLLGLVDLRERLRRWLSLQSLLHTVVVVGGGKLVDGLRDIDRTLGLDQELIHFSAVDLMSINMRLVQSWFPESHIATEQLEIPTTSNSLPVFFDCRKWCRGNKVLPRSWHTTSDSIAAAIACEFKATELVLVKSTLPSPILSLDEIVTSNFVDLEFRNQYRGVCKLRFVNLTDDRFPEVSFAPQAGRLN